MTGPLISLDPGVIRLPGSNREVQLEWPATGRRVRLSRATYQLAQRFAIPATLADVAADLGASAPAGRAAVGEAVARLRDEGVLTEWRPAATAAQASGRGLFGAPVTGIAEALRGPARAIVIGAPFDGAVTYRAGAKFAPDELRRVSHGLLDIGGDPRGGGAHDPVTGRIVLDRVPLADLGNLPASPGDGGAELLAGLADAVEAVASVRRLPVVLGGDHSISLRVIDGLRAAYGRIGVIHIDAHHDFGGPRSGPRTGVHHGNFLDWVVGAPGVAAVAQLGVRQLTRDAPAAHPTLHRWPGVQALTAGMSAVRDRLPEGLRWHLSIDVDVLDPSVMPTTGTLLPGGWSHRELIGVVEDLARRLDIVGLDLVEFIPGDEGAAMSACDVVLRVLDARFAPEGEHP